MAVMVVTSSGREVPIATMVIAIIASGIPIAVAIAEPWSTRRSEPITSITAPNTKNTIFITTSFLVNEGFSSVERSALADLIFSQT